MSRTYVIACHKCRAALWVGQGQNSKTFAESGFLYRTSDAIADLGSFFARHQGHGLEFNNDEAGPILDYEDVGAMEPGPRPPNPIILGDK